MTWDRLDYSAAGVDISAGDGVSRMFGLYARSTRRSGVIGEVGGFGGLFDLGAAGKRDQILVAGADGVGTKLLVAVESGRHENIGVDLVAMCVNDILTHGAEPLFFLDYYATGVLAAGRSESLAAGIARGCRMAGCALLGGETAEMPGLYDQGHYDLAGFALGAVAREHLLPRASAFRSGDRLIGLASSGLHANGFSLVRAIIERAGIDLNANAPFAPESSLAEALLTPTVIYVDTILPVLETGSIKAMAHITGGGLEANMQRILTPESALAVRMDFDALPRMPVFDWLAETGPVAFPEMRSVFNLGIGMVAVAGNDDTDVVMAALKERGQDCRVIGELVVA